MAARRVWNYTGLHEPRDHPAAEIREGRNSSLYALSRSIRYCAETFWYGRGAGPYQSKLNMSSRDSVVVLEDLNCSEILGRLPFRCFVLVDSSLLHTTCL